MNFCRYGHGHHSTQMIEVDLDNHRVPDYPSFRKFPGIKFPFEIYSEEYNGQPDYCPADDEVSRSIRINGVWEGFETLLFIDIMNTGEGAFIDFGSQLGWYSKIAAIYGHEVYGFEADPENIRVSRDNVPNAHFTCDWINEDFELPFEGHIRAAKADLEGAEVHALNSCKQFFKDGTIDYFFLEVTPAFANYEFLEEYLGYGYELYLIPDKGFFTSPGMSKFEKDPLLTTITVGRRQLNDVLHGEQVNVILRKHGNGH